MSKPADNPYRGEIVWWHSMANADESGPAWLIVYDDAEDVEGEPELVMALRWMQSHATIEFDLTSERAQDLNSALHEGLEEMARIRAAA